MPSELWLDELAAVLEEAMGWMGGHLHLFQIDGDTFGMYHPGWEPIGLDESRYCLRDVLGQVGTKMRWMYDLGDSWEHDVFLEGSICAHARWSTRGDWPGDGRARPRTPVVPGATS